ncbi:MAG TPA: DUF3089 domain-containing protein [Bacteroidia bacterium]|jgi:hypothetical protein|nr:DUF3089 domain-containing protein [Bacteroidia bacterium]
MKNLSKYNLSCLLLIFIGFFFTNCRPLRSFDRSSQPDEPVYSNESAWIALPWRKDAPDTVPLGCSSVDQQQIAKADVFFIHPTMYFKGSKWNASLSNKRVNKKSDRTVMYQASVFNSSGRVFAPRYRQAILSAFFHKKGKKAIDLAYADIRKAFEYYMKNWNGDRPIILAGHSQGALHAFNLLKDYFDGKELQNKLIVAYPIGIPFDKDLVKSIPISNDSSATGVYVTWNTMKWNTKNKKIVQAYEKTACVNPLTMGKGEEPVSSAFNKGGLSFLRFSIDKNVCDAKVQGSLLWIHRPAKNGYFNISRSYHVSDYGLFYMNIRTNAELRVRNYFRK